MLRGLYEPVSDEDQFNIACNVFGREKSQQSRAWKYFVNHIYDNFFGSLLTIWIGGMKEDICVNPWKR